MRGMLGGDHACRVRARSLTQFFAEPDSLPQVFCCLSDRRRGDLLPDSSASLTTWELTEAVCDGYRRADWNEKGKTQHEFVPVTNYHRKHVIHSPCRVPDLRRLSPVRSDDDLWAVLIALSEAGDRRCLSRHGSTRFDDLATYRS